MIKITTVTYINIENIETDHEEVLKINFEDFSNEEKLEFVKNLIPIEVEVSGWDDDIYIILDGNHRYNTMRELGYNDIACVIN